MKRILHLNSSIQGNESYSNKLGNAIVEKIQEKYADSIVEEVNLVGLDLPHINAEVLQLFSISEQNLTAEEKESVRYSNEAIVQLFAADIIVIGAPLYNFTIHTALKAWIDHIARAGITFGYGEKGPVGLVKGKKVYVAMASGAIYSEGRFESYDFVAPYLKNILGFMGMTDLTVIRVEGVRMPAVKEHALKKAIDSIVID